MHKMKHHIYASITFAAFFFLLEKHPG